MIVRISGKLVEQRPQSLIINTHGLFYEILVPSSVLGRLDQIQDETGNIQLVVYHYFQIGPGSGAPILIGFVSELERDFFLEFIKVSGIGPRAAVRALNQPISEISRAIDRGDTGYLKTLPGIGIQRAKEIVAKLQGKIGRFGLIQDHAAAQTKSKTETTPQWQEEALTVLLQLQYKRQEALSMIDKALERVKDITSTEELLNEIYRQRIQT